jgi:tetratricopeptide (TPR) repeat protein
MKNWNPFPHDAASFQYRGRELQAAWAALHSGDCVAFCDREWLQGVLETAPAAAPPGFDGDLTTLAKQIQEAWRQFHTGNFFQAVELGQRAGVLGHAPANKAAGIYATYLEPDPALQKACFLDAVSRAEEAVAVLPDDPNSHYFLAFNLGRYSQSISVAKALRQGIGGRIQTSLERTLEIEPRHAEAHTAFGMYHAEIIDKVGKMIGGMTYGASVDKALEHFETALELTPDAPIAHIEYGNGLYLLFGDRKIDEVTELYVKASEMEPRDAMEKLDVEAALAELE